MGLEIRLSPSIYRIYTKSGFRDLVLSEDFDGTKWDIFIDTSDSHKSPIDFIDEGYEVIERVYDDV